MCKDTACDFLLNRIEYTVEYYGVVRHGLCGGTENKMKYSIDSILIRENTISITGWAITARQNAMNPDSSIVALVALPVPNVFSVNRQNIIPKK